MDSINRPMACNFACDLQAGTIGLDFLFKNFFLSFSFVSYTPKHSNTTKLTREFRATIHS